MSRFRLACVVCGAAALVAGPLVTIAHAEGPASLVVTRTERAADCPDTGGLVARGKGSLVAGDPTIPHPGSSEPQKHIVVSFDRDGELRRAQIATPNGGRRALSDRASDCNGLAEAVVLALVLASDGRDTREEAPPPPAPPPAAPDRDRAQPARGDSSSPTDGLTLRLGAGGVASIAQVRESAFGAQLGAHLGTRTGWWTIGVLGTWLPPSSIDFAGGSAEVSYLGGALEGCIHRSLVASPALALEGCARGEAGSVRGSASGFLSNESRSRPLFAGAAVARGILEVTGPLSLFVEGVLRAPFHRERFAIDGAGTIYEPPAVGGGVTAGAAVSIR